MSQTLLDVENLAIAFKAGSGYAAATRGVDLALSPGETMALVGESGSGKSVTALALMGLLPRNAQVTHRRMRFDGQDLGAFQTRDWQRLRGPGIAMVFQDPMTSLNPLMRCGEQVAEGIRLHRNISHAEARRETLTWFEAMDLPEPERRYQAYPFEMSGGQRQRVMIAMALACKPKLLIADEPTTALDVTVQAHILKLLKRAQAEHGMALLLITHDLGIVRDCVERVQVMYAGSVVESGPVDSVLNQPMHPYTRGLLDSIPNPDKPVARLKAIEGVVPPAGQSVAGCRFHPRCGFAEATCKSGEMPGLQRIAIQGDSKGSRWTACPIAMAHSRWQEGGIP
jgi:oligopeptide/dipeptide ABC transporter ATP-binding protein